MQSITLLLFLFSFSCYANKEKLLLQAQKILTKKYKIIFNELDISKIEDKQNKRLSIIFDKINNLKSKRVKLAKKSLNKTSNTKISKLEKKISHQELKCQNIYQKTKSKIIDQRNELQNLNNQYLKTLFQLKNFYSSKKEFKKDLKKHGLIL